MNRRGRAQAQVQRWHGAVTAEVAGTAGVRTWDELQHEVVGAVAVQGLQGAAAAVPELSLAPAGVTCRMCCLACLRCCQQLPST